MNHHPVTRDPDRRQRRLDTPIGTITLIADDETLTEVRFANAPDVAEHDIEPADDHPVLGLAAAQLEEYFAGRRTEFDVPLKPSGTAFQQAAWKALRTIPYAETVSYGEQARRLGDPAKARAVGAANGRNPLPIIVPCHRVVGSNGHLTGFGGGVECKAWLLDHERAVAERGSSTPAAS